MFCSWPLADDRHHRHHHRPVDGDADRNDRAVARLTADEECAVTGQVVFVGDDADASTP